MTVFICVPSYVSRGRRSERPGKQKRTERRMAVSLMTSCQRCGRARSSIRTCPRWNVTASGSTTRTQTRAGSDQSQSWTSKWARSLATPCSSASLWGELTSTFLFTLLHSHPPRLGWTTALRHRSRATHSTTWLDLSSSKILIRNRAEAKGWYSWTKQEGGKEMF